MLEEFKHIWNNELKIWKKKEIFLAISGGKDSMVLSHVLYELEIEHTLLHCNFQLRGAESDEDETFVSNYAHDKGIRFESVRFDTKGYAQNNKLTIQEAARDLRYEWFDSFIDNPRQQLLFTAHHASDSMETFFLNLMRGTSLKGLTGIEMERGYILRPLMPFTVDLIALYINENKIAFREDKSNADLNYNRNFVRHEVIPMIKKRSSDFDKKMASTMDSLKTIQSYIRSEADSVRKRTFKESNAYVSIDIKQLALIHDAILEEIMKTYSIGRSQFKEFKSFLLSSSGSEFTSTTYRFTNHRDILYIEKLEEKHNAKPRLVINSHDKDYSLEGGQLNFRTQILSNKLTYTADILQWDAEQVTLPLTIRLWQHGDRFNPLGLNGSKLISDYINDKKLNPIEKREFLVVCDSTGQIIGIPGFTIAEDFKITGNTTSILTLTKSVED